VTTAEPHATGQERIRVLLMLPSLHGGGAERIAVHVMNHANPEAFDVRMGLLRRAGPYLAEVDPSRVDVSPFGQRFLDFDGLNPEIYRPWKLLPGVALAPANALALLLSFRPHVVMSFLKGTSVITQAAVAMYGRKRVRWIAREGNNTLAVLRSEVKNPIAFAAMRRLMTNCYRSADRLLTISEDMARDLVRDLRLPRERVRTIHNCVDVTYVKRRAREEPAVPVPGPFLVYVGRLHPQKGVDLLLEAYACSRARERYRLVLVGDGAQREALRALAERLGVAGRVVTTGFVDNPWSLMSRARAFVLPSLWEGFGNVVIEAMACGAPVIVTDCDFGPREVVRHGESGLVVKTGDVTALSAAIDHVALSDSLRDGFARAGESRARDFDLPVIVKRYEDLFREVAATL
jgi:glycosyltransferase involved in cell wall biosynthesis